MAFFKRWSRKSFAIFNSLKLEIKICTLNVCLHLNAPTLIRELFLIQNFDSDNPPEEEELLIHEMEVLQLLAVSNNQSFVEGSRSVISNTCRQLIAKTTFSQNLPFSSKLIFQDIYRFLLNGFTRKGILLSNFS